jgi:hypothetical protein
LSFRVSYEKNTQISYFLIIRSVGAELLPEDGQMDRDMTKLIVATWKEKGQLDATDCSLLQKLLFENMFRAPLCPSSGAQEYYTGGSCLWYLVLWFTGCWFGVELHHPANRAHNQQLHTKPTNCKPKHQAPQAASTCKILLSS